MSVVGIYNLQFRPVTLISDSWGVPIVSQTLVSHATFCYPSLMSLRCIAPIKMSTSIGVHKSKDYYNIVQIERIFDIKICSISVWHFERYPSWTFWPLVSKMIFGSSDLVLHGAPWARELNKHFSTFLDKNISVIGTEVIFVTWFYVRFYKLIDAFPNR